MSPVPCFASYHALALAYFSFNHVIHIQSCQTLEGSKHIVAAFVKVKRHCMCVEPLAGLTHSWGLLSEPSSTGYYLVEGWNKSLWCRLPFHIWKPVCLLIILEIEAMAERRHRHGVQTPEQESSVEQITAPCPGDTLPWNLPKHQRIKRSKSTSGEVLDPAERAVIRIAGRTHQMVHLQPPGYMMECLIHFQQYIYQVECKWPFPVQAGYAVYIKAWKQQLEAWSAQTIGLNPVQSNSGNVGNTLFIYTLG